MANGPWYSAGLAFECLRCGKCCAGPAEGYVWTSRDEVSQAARFLGLSFESFIARYGRSVDGRLSLREEPCSRDCVFLAHDSAGHSLCRIYPVRPAQCRTWPFWPQNLSSSAAWCLAVHRCPGINRGPMHELEHIEQQRRQAGP